MSIRQGRQLAKSGSSRTAAKGQIEPEFSVDAGPESTRKSLEIIVGASVFLGFLLLFLGKAPGLGFFMAARDHGYQLSIATQVLLGRIPGIDVVIAYGPLVMYTSAMGLWLSHSLIGETIVCSTGYALSLFLLYHLVSRYTSKLAGLSAAGFGLLLQARFYKWYVWLIPLTILWVWHRYLGSAPARRWRWVLVGGTVLGISWLYRPDFGTAELLICLVFLGLFEASEPPRDLPGILRSLGLFLVAFSVFPLVWLGYLVFRVGPLAPLTYLETTVQAIFAVSTGMSLPPTIRSAIVAYWLIPALYLLSLVAVWRRWSVGRLEARSWFLLASALVGTGCFHQAMFRMEPLHLLQVVPPAIICTSLIASEALGGASGLNLPVRAKPWIRLAAVGYVTLLVVLGLKLSRWGQIDLEPLSPWPLERYSGLANPLGQPGHDPRAAALAAVMKQTAPWEPILVFPIDPQFYALARRRISGRLHAYYAGVLDSPRHCAENLRAVEADMPKLVIVPTDFEKDPNETVDLLVGQGRRAHEYLERFIRQHYPRVVLNEGGIMVLSR